MHSQWLTRRQVLVGGVVGMASLMAPRERARAGLQPAPAAAAGTLKLGGDLLVNRMGFGAMRITGAGIWGEPKDPAEARRVLRRAVELGVDFIDTADAYGPEVSERLIAEALHPYPAGLIIATKGGLVRPGPSEGAPDGGPARGLRAGRCGVHSLGTDRARFLGYARRQRQQQGARCSRASARRERVSGGDRLAAGEIRRAGAPPRDL